MPVGPGAGVRPDGGAAVQRPVGSMTARVVSGGVFSAVATTSTVRRSRADATGICRLALRVRGRSPTSPRSQRSSCRPAVAHFQSRGDQNAGRSAVSRRAVPVAVPPVAWTRTVYVIACWSP
ncbi:hypothetical protein BJF79_18215 [Actinomadura sp. CNU-125]|nr:hypothetical protein BJF79_18215 [Actinomadura sp. CNU-125]